MFCKNCGNQIPDNSKFCEKCGYSFEQNTNVHNNAEQPNVQPYVQSYTESQPPAEKKTNYGTISLIISVASMFLICFIIPLFVSGPLSTIFGALAIKNKEPGIVKAYVGLGIGILQLLIIIAAIANGNV